MIFRRSRLLLVVAFVLVIHFLIFIYINDLSLSEYLPQAAVAATAATKSLYALVHSKFQTEILDPFHENKLDPESSKLLYSLKFSEYPDHDVLVPKNYFHEEGDAADSPPPLITYDPRLTASMVLNYLTEQLEYNTDISSVELPFFHWSDYVDMSVLEPYRLNPEKQDCSFLSITSNNGIRDRKLEIFPVDTYCVDDKNIESFDFSNIHPPIDQSRVDSLKKANRFSTGFHVFKYGGRSKQDFKALHSRSYLNDFMPSPLSMVLLLPAELNDIGGTKQLSNAIKIPINQNSNGLKPMYKTSLLKNLRKDVKGDEDFNVNVKNYLQAFLDKLHTTESYKQLLEKNSEVVYEKHMVHEDFVNNATEIREQLDQEFANTPITDPHLKNYKEGLDVSLESPYPYKYFFEAKLIRKEKNWDLGGHYDWRFFSGIINYTKAQPPVLHGLIRAWFQFINNYNIRSWIAHGTLLSWFWNGIAFPWDIDFDVQMPIQDLHYLCRNFNQSLVMDVGFGHFEGDIRHGRYFLDCGTFISNRDNKNGHNNIDARFIDVENGLYIDITGLALTETPSPDRYNDLLPPSLKKTNTDETVGHLDRNKYLQIYNCKNRHFESLQNLSPLRLTKYEGQLNYIPQDFKSLLINEYKERAINVRKFKTFSFIEKYQLWELTKNLIRFVKARHGIEGAKLRKYRASNSAVTGMSIIDEQFKDDDDFIDYLFEHKELLMEYILSHDITEFHKKEMELLNEGKSTESLFTKKGQFIDKNHSFRPDHFYFHNFMTDYSFKNRNDKLISSINEGGGEKIEQIDKDIGGQDSTPQPLDDAIDELKIINSVKSSTPVVVKQVEVQQGPPDADGNPGEERIVSEKIIESPSTNTEPKLDENGLPVVQQQKNEHLNDNGIMRPSHPEV